MDEINTSTVDENDEIYWLCRTCEKCSDLMPNNGVVPANWDDSIYYGLRCSKCVRDKVLPT